MSFSGHCCHFFFFFFFLLESCMVVRIVSSYFPVSPASYFWHLLPWHCCSCGNAQLSELIWPMIYVTKKTFSPLVNPYPKKDEPSCLSNKSPIRFSFQNNMWHFLFLENGNEIKVPLQNWDVPCGVWFNTTQFRKLLCLKISK